MNTPVTSPDGCRSVSRGAFDSRREQHANRLRLLRMRELVERGHGAALVNAINGDERHFVRRSDEWPALKRIRDAQLELMARRTQIVASIIEAGYRRELPAFLVSR